MNKKETQICSLSGMRGIVTQAVEENGAKSKITIDDFPMSEDKYEIGIGLIEFDHVMQVHFSVWIDMPVEASDKTGWEPVWTPRQATEIGLALIRHAAVAEAIEKRRAKAPRPSEQHKEAQQHKEADKCD